MDVLTLIELGFMQNGILIYEKSFYTIKGLSDKNIQLKSQILDAIFKMTQTTLEEPITRLKMKGYIIYFKQIEKKITYNNNSRSRNDNYLIYVVGDSKLKQEESQKLLEKILDLYFNKYNMNKNSNIVVSYDENSEFAEEVNKIIGDFYTTLLDRMENIFF